MLPRLAGAYVEDMYEAWAHDPKSVHPSWDSYFRTGGYQAPPNLGASTRPNEVNNILNNVCQANENHLFANAV